MIITCSSPFISELEYRPSAVEDECKSELLFIDVDLRSFTHKCYVITCFVLYTLDVLTFRSKSRKP